ncbi:Transmembrane 4 L6 Family Member 1 [Manis pentadactyla]|nr:Transmembrane 4 L6 Family Member 1 [Manis pentadactyla]
MGVPKWGPVDGPGCLDSLGHFNRGVSGSELEPPCEVLLQMGVAGILARPGRGGGRSREGRFLSPAGASH